MNTINRLFLLPVIGALLVYALPCELQGQAADEGKLRIIAFGAHPDDCELNSGGVAALWAEKGHAFKCVSMTNGDIGHFGMSGGELALRRMEEVEEAAEVLGISTEVMDIHDGELMPTLENRKKVARLIRDWQADIVMVHRRYDYHPDHRYGGVLIDDATVLVMAKYFTPDTPHLAQNPVVLYYHDGFEKPYPFQPDVVVGIDDVAEKKWRAIEQMPSQFSDKQSWTWGTRGEIPDDEDRRMEMRINEIKERFENQADTYRGQLIELYGSETGQDIRYAESFELSQYGRQVSVEELKDLLPSFD